MVDFSSTYTRRSDTEWDIVVLQKEIRALQLEKEHLDTKKIERQLSRWELSRSEELLDEAMHIMSMIGTLRKELQNT